MIKIVITRKNTERYTVQENVLKERIPTDHREERSSYGDTRVAYRESYEVREVTKERFSEETLLHQEFSDECLVNLSKIIAAVNGLQLPDDSYRDRVGG